MRTSIQQGLVQYIALLFALVVHESAHAYSAHKMGDDTAKNLGRISLNPIAHIDIIGTVLFPLLQIFGGFVFFGWAKPVPVNPLNLKDQKSGIFWVSFAGPLSNLIMGTAFLITFLLLKNVNLSATIMVPIFYLLLYSVIINFALAIFNMLPIPPLDGSGVLFGLLPGRIYNKYIEPIAPYGFIILLGLLWLGVFEMIIRPVINILTSIMGVG